jgi:phage shock protein A
MWANIATIIVALIGSALVGYAMTRGKSTESRATSLAQEVKELNATVKALQRTVTEQDERIKVLEAELEHEKQARHSAEGQLTFFQTAMSGMTPRAIEDAERNRRK